eukprot:300603-Amphidinium_carterae.1
MHLQLSCCLVVLTTIQLDHSIRDSRTVSCRVGYLRPWVRVATSIAASADQASVAPQGLCMACPRAWR